MTQNKPPKQFFKDGAEVPKMQTVKSNPAQAITPKHIQNGAEVPTMQPVQTAQEKGQGGNSGKK